MGLNWLQALSKTVNLPNLVSDIAMTDEQAERLRLAQLESVGNLTTVTILAGLLNSCVIMLMFSDGPLANLFSLWGVALYCAMGYIMVTHVRHQGRTQILSTDDRMRRYVRGATLIGVFWAIVPLMAFPIGDDMDFALSGIILTATMFGGVLLIGRIPDAAMGFVLPIIVGMLAALQIQQDPRNDLLSVITIVYGAMLYFGSRLSHTHFAQQHLSQDALEHQAEVIGLLLKDFEENASDMLWQTDAKGLITDLPELVANNHASSRWSPLVGEGFLTQFEQNDAFEAIASAFQKRHPFKDMAVKSNRDGTVQWWSITGKPLFQNGIFEGYRGVISDITQARKIEEQIDYIAHHDELTGLPNRNSFKETLRALASTRIVGGEGEWFIIWFGMDRFKWINETVGHEAGDEMLRGVADRLRSFVSDKGFICRISGDEFAMVDYAPDYASIRNMVDGYMAKMEEPYTVWDSLLTCRVSAGVKILPHGLYDTGKILKQADTALHAAKLRERGSWCMFDHTMEERMRGERQLEADLQKAIEHNELELFFQPIVGADSRKVVAVESLLRWNHPQRGILGPEEFIEFAEDNGLITRIGSWTLRKAIENAARLPDDVRVAINVSPVQIHSEDLVPTLVNALATFGVEAARIELEITESVMINDAKFTMQRLAQIQNLGVRIALDDFGTGFSSLSYLRQFPFDKLKIDKCFTEELETDEDSRAITQATLSLAKALKMRCTGEGVETPAQANFLRDNGCEELQGFMFSRPQPLEKLAHLVPVAPPSTSALDANKVVALSERPSKPDLAVAKANKRETG